MNEMSKIVAESKQVDAPLARNMRVLMLSVPVIILVVAAYFWFMSGKTVTTDNALIGAPVVTISTEVGGKILDVAVHENQHVKAGDLLFRLDSAPFQIALLQAQAALSNARASVNEMTGTAASKVADAENKTAMIGASRSQVALARDTYQRQIDLMKRGFTTRAQLDAARSALLSAQASEAGAVAEQVSAQASAVAARAKIGTEGGNQNPAIAAAMALVEKAQLDLRRTEVRAPIDGIVTQSDKLQPGNVAIQSLAQLSLVGDGGYWIEANFKETQLEKIRVGQLADVEIDALPSTHFKARVTGLGAGTGAQFSLLPAQNATGNWVKVTQRVPVRLALVDPPKQPLAAGWSATVTVHIAH